MIDEQTDMRLPYFIIKQSENIYKKKLLLILLF